MNLVSLLFGFNGRISRAQYWLGCIIGGVGGAMLLFVLSVLATPAEGYPKTPDGLVHFISSASLALGLPMLLMGWVGMALQTKRFHDRGRSGLWTLAPMAPLFMIMTNVVAGAATGASFEHVAASIGMWFMLLQIVNLVMFVDLGCMPGKNEPNKYGNPPGGGFSGGAPLSGSPFPGQSSAMKGQPMPGMGSTLTNAENAIERAIAARNKQAQAPAVAAVAAAMPMAARPAMAVAEPVAGLRPASGGSFGRRASR